MMSFTGSTRAGVEVAKNAAPTVKRVAQELGGKSANIVLPSADVGETVGRDFFGMCMNTGQSCNAGTRILVPAEKMDEAAARPLPRPAITVGDPTSDGVVMGPVVSEAQWNKVQGLIQTGIDEGATLAAGGTGRPDGLDEGYFVKPTVFADVTNDMTIAQEEIFGPVVSIIGYDSVEQAIEIANDTEYGLAGYISGDQDEAVAVAKRIRTGMMHVNGPAPTSTPRSAATSSRVTVANGASSASRSSSRARPFSALAPDRVPASAPGCVHLGAGAVGFP